MIDYKLISVIVIFSLIVISITYIINIKSESLIDNMVQDCLETYDVVNNEIHTKICLGVMERFDYDTKGDYRQELYESVKINLKGEIKLTG